MAALDRFHCTDKLTSDGSRPAGPGNFLLVVTGVLMILGVLRSPTGVLTRAVGCLLTGVLKPTGVPTPATCLEMTDDLLVGVEYMLGLGLVVV